MDVTQNFEKMAMDKNLKLFELKLRELMRNFTAATGTEVSSINIFQNRDKDPDIYLRYAAKLAPKSS